MAQRLQVTGDIKPDRFGWVEPLRTGWVLYACDCAEHVLPLTYDDYQRHEAGVVIELARAWSINDGNRRWLPLCQKALDAIGDVPGPDYPAFESAYHAGKCAINVSRAYTEVEEDQRIFTWYAAQSANRAAKTAVRAVFEYHGKVEAEAEKKWQAKRREYYSL